MHKALARAIKTIHSPMASQEGPDSPHATNLGAGGNPDGQAERAPVPRADVFAEPAWLPPPGEQLRTLDGEDFDRGRAERILKRYWSVIQPLFRPRVEGIEHIDPKNPGILVQNHNWATFGGIEGAAFFHAWYVAEKDRKLPRLVGQGGPVANDHRFMRRLGIVRASLKNMTDALQRGHYVGTTPGAEVDQLRPVWQRNRSRLKRVSWLGKRPVLSDCLSYVAVAAEGGYPIYPVACSGSHEMAPILWESPRLLRWTGLHRAHWIGTWSGFPITLNHLVNFALFALTPLAGSLWAWAIFLLANIYFAPLYQYPLLPVQVRLRVSEPVPVPDLRSSAISETERMRVYREVHAKVVSRIDEMLDELDDGRPWIGVWRWFGSQFRRLRAA